MGLSGGECGISEANATDLVSGGRKSSAAKGVRMALFQECRLLEESVCCSETPLVKWSADRVTGTSRIEKSS